MAALIPAVLESIGFVVTETIGEVAGQRAGAAISGAVVGGLSDKINEAVTSGLVMAVGEERVKNVKAAGSEFIDEAKAINNLSRGVFDPTGESGLDFFINTRTKQKPKSIRFNEPVKPMEDLSRFAHSAPELTKSGTPGPTAPTASGKYTTMDIAKFVTGFSNNLATQGLEGNVLSPDLALAKHIKENPEHAELAITMGAFLESKIPNTEAYLKIAAVYNGRNQDGSLMIAEKNMTPLQDPTRNNLIYFVLKNELGENIILHQTTGLILPTPSDYTFVGPRSANADLPASRPNPNAETQFSLLDFYAAFHDANYENGPIITADYEFISRISQNFSSLDPADIPWARFSIIYFSTLGNMVSHMFNSDEEIVHTVSSIEPDIKFNVTDEFFQTTTPILTNQSIDKVEFEEALLADIADEHDQVFNPSVNRAILAHDFGAIEIGLL